MIRWRWRSRPGRVLAGLALAVGLGAAVLGPLGGCEMSTAPSPFTPDAGQGGGGGGGGGGTLDAGPDADPTLGGPCSADEQCDDELGCTFDGCDQTISRCRFVPDDSQCQNEAYCDGVERCDNKHGCVLGEPVTCSDGNACHIDTCDEQNDQCLSEPRDVDQDGDPDIHCGGGDCDDFDPAVSSLEFEVCANGKDDDCDGLFDEPACLTPAHDNCLDPLDLAAPGSFLLETAAAALDYGSACGVTNQALARDVVAAVLLGAGPPVDVQLTARTAQADVALSLVGQCGDPQSEITCSGGFAHPDTGRVAKVRGRSLGAAQSATAWPAYLFTDASSQVTLRYELLPASTKPVNETCGTAAALVPATPTLASIVDAAVDLASSCAAYTGELVYSFDLASPQDVDLFASSIDGDGLPVISLRSDACALPADEIACNAAAAAHVFRHSMPAGSYRVAVSATAPTEALLTLELSPPTSPPADEDCTGAPPLLPGLTIDVPLSGHQDDHDTGCLPGAVDAAYTLDLAQSSDVLVLGRFSQGDAAAVVLSDPSCGGPADSRACGTASVSPARAQAHNVPAGSYRVIAESAGALPMQLTALMRPAVPPTLVPFADTCAQAIDVPPSGGFFQGTTANAQAQYDAGCDQGGQPPGGAPEQMLRLVLSTTKRVVLDMQGSAYPTLLDVRAGPSCPGQELTQACAAGYFPERSFLDLELAAGSYFIQVDGYAGHSGPWFLDVYLADP